VHKALDYPTPVGTKFRVARAGVVKVAGWSTTGFGNHIRVLLDDGNTVIYGHLSRFLVSVGQRVTAGQIIGLTGNTGNSTGPHLHMEVRTSSWQPWTAWNFTDRLIDAPQEDPLSALSDSQQKDLYNQVRETNNRVMGMLQQRYYVIKDGAAVPCSAGVEGAIPARALDSLDGDYLRRRIVALEQEIAALKAAQ
jgi:murein DD-endopeptidase MepM/ murein hydrolase activator NlpD